MVIITCFYHKFSSDALHKDMRKLFNSAIKEFLVNLQIVHTLISTDADSTASDVCVPV